MVRKNRKPVWYDFLSRFCVSCGNNFKDGEMILLSQYCNDCGIAKENELKLTKKLAIEWIEFRNSCVKCSKPFQVGDTSLFGIYCIKCGKKWEKERKIRMQHQLRKARNIQSKNQII